MTASMTHCSITLLGPLRIERAGAVLAEGNAAKPWALLAYLAVEADRPHAREHLAALLWPDQPEQNARQNLRWALAVVRRALGDAAAECPLLLVSREQLQFNTAGACSVDLHQLNAALADPHNRAAQHAAVAGYRGELLAGLSLPESELFESWLAEQRLRVQRNVTAALARLVTAAEQQADAEALGEYAQRWLAIEPWAEPAHRALMRAFYGQGRRSAALLQYEQCRQRLAADLGIEPEPATTALYEQLRREQPPVGAGIPGATAIDRNRQRMIERVARFWIAGVLEPTLKANPALTVPLRITAGPFHPAHPGALQAIADVVAAYDRFDGDLLIRGAVGAGKTTLLLQLAQTLLERAAADPGRPIPMIFNLTDWEARHTDLAAWMVEALHLRYQVPPTLARDWIAADRIAPLLDGLDEVTPELRPTCIAALTRFRSTHWPGALVICCRDGIPVEPLNPNGIVELQPLDLNGLEPLLATDGDAALHALFAADPAWRAIGATPLGLSLLREAANDPALAAPHPQAHSDAAQRRIIASYVEQIINRRSWLRQGAADYRRQLAWLARGMQRHHTTIFQIEALQPSWLPHLEQRRLFAAGEALILGVFLGLVAGLDEGLRLAFSGTAGGVGLGLLTGLTVGIGLGGLWGAGAALRVGERTGGRSRLGQATFVGSLAGAIYGVTTGMLFGPLLGLGVGLAVGLVFLVLLALLGRAQSIAPIDRFSWSVTRALHRAPFGLLAGGAAGLVFSLLDGPAIGGAVGGATSIGVSAGLGLTGFGFDERARPNEGIRRSARTALQAGPAIGGLGWLTFALAVGISTAVGDGGAAGRLVYGQQSLAMIGLLNGVGPGLIGGAVGLIAFGGLAVVQHGLLRLLLWRSGAAPLNLAAFLDDAVQLQLLRKVGGGYMFTHRLLLEYAAEEERHE
jgi:DNA-binding SARP family transcriptional activator